MEYLAILRFDEHKKEYTLVDKFNWISSDNFSWISKKPMVAEMKFNPFQTFTGEFEQPLPMNGDLIKFVEEGFVFEKSGFDGEIWWKVIDSLINCPTIVVKLDYEKIKIENRSVFKKSI